MRAPSSGREQNTRQSNLREFSFGLEEKSSRLLSSNFVSMFDDFLLAKNSYSGCPWENNNDWLFFICIFS